jgi:hypothetical protein
MQELVNILTIITSLIVIYEFFKEYQDQTILKNPF